MIGRLSQEEEEEEDGFHHPLRASPFDSMKSSSSLLVRGWEKCHAVVGEEEEEEEQG